jgi:small GTP-binding protein
MVIAEHAPGLEGAGSFFDALALWREPAWRVAVVGRVSVGKSTLVNALAGRAACAVGLGGVTREAVDVRVDAVDPPVVLVDTPGMDGTERVPPALDGVIASADAVLWVVDGLQPITRTERHALSERIPRGMAVHVVVSRVDLVEETEVSQVLARVRTLTSSWQPRSVRTANLREAERTGEPNAFPELTAPRPWPSWRRRDPMRAALATLHTALADVPPPADPEGVLEEVAEAWRDMVRGAETTVAEEIHDGTLDHRALAERRLYEVAQRQREAFLARLEGNPLGSGAPPAIPLPDLPQHGAVDLVGGMGGAGSAARSVRALAGRWMMEGEIVLGEWVARMAQNPKFARARAERATFEVAIREAIDLVR